MLSLFIVPVPFAGPSTALLGPSSFVVIIVDGSIFENGGEYEDCSLSRLVS